MKKLVLIFFVGICFKYAKSQQEVMASQYMFNGLFLNPAYAGSHKYFSSSFLQRNQWVNFVGAPKTSLLAIDGPLLDQKMGVGLLVAYDKIGVTNQADMYLNYSYMLKMGESGKLSLGLKAGASQYSANKDNLIKWDGGDEVLSGASSALIPKFGAGAYYFTDNWYAGISVPSLVTYGSVQNLNVDLRQHYYLTGGYVAVVAEKWKVKPSFLLKYQKAAPVQADINVTAMYIDQVAIGVSYRTGDAFIVMAEYQANKRFRVGYAYDMTTSMIKKYSAGTHELMLGFDFGKEEVIKTKNPRFF